MKVIDLTHLIKEGMMVYPGTDAPTVRPACTLEKDGFCETHLSMFSHVGTHVDAPAHLFATGRSLDAFEAAQFVGNALVIDCRALPDGAAIDMALLRTYGEELTRADYLLFCTGYDKKWGDGAYFGEFPCLDDEALDFVIRTGYKGIGSDTMSMDPMSAAELPRHKRFLSSGDVINVENLTGLEQCIGKGLVRFICLPLKYANADGAPARAIAMIEE